ncbi:MAG: carbohydrate kinase [Bacteroidales bacterium]|nr:carbohydrate kinase [Bacteroidales bacterium]
MRNIYTIGETVFDIIFKNSKPCDAKAGGAMLNTAVSLGRLDMTVSLISEYGKDKAGKLIDDFLISNGVNTKFIFKFSNGKTAISLAFLDDRNEAEYTFFKLYPKERLNIEFPQIKKNDIVLFGSFYSLSPEVREQVMRFIENARKAEAIIIYDPNIRKPHKDQIESLRKFIIRNISVSDIVRGSDEDFSVIFNINNPQSAYNKIRQFDCKNLIYTASDKGVFLFTPKIQKEYSVAKIKTVSTIGAGDNFNAGIIFSIIKNNILKSDLDNVNENILDDMISCGINFSADVCMSYENYISRKFANKTKSKFLLSTIESPSEHITLT